MRIPPISTLFPYTTLFRSRSARVPGQFGLRGGEAGDRHPIGRAGDVIEPDLAAEMRSEEHTSELQSHSDIVCRLLLEKKKQKENLYHETNMNHIYTST